MPSVISSPHDHYRLGDFLMAGLASDAVAFFGAAAFAQRSGLRYIAGALETFSSTKPTQLVVGVDLHGTSVEALELLLNSAGKRARFYVFHNPAAAFHPKVYRFDYKTLREVYVGSGNLTKGGLFENYETGLVAKFMKGVPADDTIVGRLGTEIETWTNTNKLTGSAKPLTAKLIKELRDRNLILPETMVLAARAAARAAAGKPKKTSALFPSVPCPRAPALPRKAGGMRSSGARLREPEARILVLKVAAKMPKRTATTDELIQRAPRYFTPSPIDLAPSKTRPLQPRWHQIIRNVISHRKGPKGPFAQGLAVRTADGLALTDKGAKLVRALGRTKP